MNNYKAVLEVRKRVLFPWTFAAIAKQSCDLSAIAGGAVCAAFLFAALSLPALGQNSLGGVSGVARDSVSGKAVADAKIIAHEMRKNTEFTAVSATNGSFVIALQSGWYEVTATKNGFVKSSAKIRVIAGKTSQLELPLAVNRAAMELMMAQEVESMKARIDQLESDLLIKRAQDYGNASAAAKDEVLLASVAKDSSQMPSLPGAIPKPQERDLLSASARPATPLPAPRR